MEDSVATDARIDVELDDNVGNTNVFVLDIHVSNQPFVSIVNMLCGDVSDAVRF